MYEILADEIVLGKDVVIEEGVIIEGKTNKRPRRVAIGDNVFIGANTRMYVDDLSIGDYTAIHNHGLVAGDKPCIIGQACWIGQNTILNSTGGLTMGNGVGVGAYSQLWSHIRFGDVLQGCLWDSDAPLIIDDDVWFVGHCIVSPIHAYMRSMAMVGSVVTKDMLPNRVYGGTPAKDLTNKIGPQFGEISVAEKLRQLSVLYSQFCQKHPQLQRDRIAIVGSVVDTIDETETTVFDVSTRTYNKLRTTEEIAFMKFLLPRIKFYPRDAHS
jgi:acetyltransferase-like isoleucine patch superfamily enzyme